ncbi:MULTISPECIES: CaiB/BaiF CoA transferase family protein [unclassified Aurantimonas]|uniref:CaiB/BaiF CoA transferase family protein n=1 Tax=unclassified Aurantimonas TaxID=2638230 RepID=UPI002E18D773|nr:MULTISPECIES: CaiB/BaiF CoA-transferase family protein [unclassified Aurantimonas]MEC5293298.1 CaiB/BaiF CoA-transferase family protein [Aurantimonas sp. C2-3-R2]MEC5414392.1 CaiB/BaiF CoA-transferase family protein [Aurantimonas sp. C2-4-R8]
MLTGMRVVSFCHYLQGPACSQYLADLGADVIKIEPPKGAFERHWSGGNSYVEGISAFMLCGNRNKRSLSIDLKRPEAAAIMERLVCRADVIVENFRPGVLDRLGLGYEDVRRVNPEIIYASATGYGATGPARDRPGQDLLMQARSGLMAVTGNHETGPVVIGCAPVDQHGGALLALGITAAYARKLKTGKGTRIEGSLFNAALDLQAEALTKYLTRRPGREVLRRDAHVGSWYHNAPYGVYRLTDAFIVLSMNDPARLAAALDSEPLRAMQHLDLYEHRDEFARQVARELENWRLNDLAAPFAEHAIWYERVQDYDDLIADPQAIHNQVFREVAIGGGTATLVNHPLRYDGELPELHRLPLAIGQDSRDVLSEIGYEQAQIEAFIGDDIVVAPARAPDTASEIPAVA